MTILVADVGGTNTRVALCSADTLQPEHIEKFRNAEFATLNDVLANYLGALGNPACALACVAVAGPVRDGVGRLTNRDWVMDAETLRRATNAGEGFVINDLEAQGHAIDRVETAQVLGSGAVMQEHASQLVVGIGTGFNAAPVHTTESGQGRHVVASECGHISLPVWNDHSYRLAQVISAKHEFASIEEVLSGRGLLHLYNHMCDDPAERLATTGEIIARMTQNPGPTEVRTANMFCEVMGRVLGDLALVHLPWGGIYLIGGLARAMVPFLPDHGFEQAFRDKGRFSDFLQDFQIHVVEDDFSALTGCASFAVRTAHQPID